MIPVTQPPQVNQPAESPQFWPDYTVKNGDSLRLGTMVFGLETPIFSHSFQ